MLKSIEEFRDAYIKKEKDKRKDKDGINEDCEIINDFNLVNEFKKAAKLFYVDISPSTHNGRFSNPSVKGVVINANCNKDNDGYLRTGNVSTDIDISLNDAALSRSAKLMNIELSDGNTIYYHLNCNNRNIIMEDLEISQDDYSEIYNLFSTNKKNNENKLSRTSKLVSQVYFNVGDTFHLFSVLSPSCIMDELKKRISKINFTKKDANVENYSRIPNLTQLRIGGAKPQNVSFMNNSNSGNYLLLNASPPELLSKRLVPKKDLFFLFNKNMDCYFKELKDMFPDITNADMRSKREKIIETIILKVVDKIFELRNLSPGWSKEKRNNLPVCQKILLDQINEYNRLEDKVWLTDFMSHFSKWILYSCNKFLDTDKAFGDIQLSEFKTIIKKNKDLFL